MRPAKTKCYTRDYHWMISGEPICLKATVIEAQDGSQMILGVIDMDAMSGVNRYMSAGMRTRIGYGHQVQGARENASESLNRQMECDCLLKCTIPMSSFIWPYTEC